MKQTHSSLCCLCWQAGLPFRALFSPPNERTRFEPDHPKLHSARLRSDSTREFAPPKPCADVGMRSRNETGTPGERRGRVGGGIHGTNQAWTTLSRSHFTLRLSYLFFLSLLLEKWTVESTREREKNSVVEA